MAITAATRNRGNPMLTTDQPELLRVRDVASTLNMSQATVYRMIANGQLGSLQLGRGQGRGRMLRVPRSDLVAYLAQINTEGQ